MGLRTHLLNDASAVLSKSDNGESVTYRPSAGGTLSRTALVVRAEPDLVQGQSEFARYQRATVWIRNDATLGITAPNDNGDKVDVALREGDAAVTCRVVKVVAGDSGLWELEVTR